MAICINDHDPVSVTKRYDDSGCCGEVVKEKLICPECGLSFHHTCSNLAYKFVGFSLISSGNNDKDPVSKSRRFDDWKFW